VYATEVSVSQTYDLLGKKVELSAGVNLGYGASLGFGRKNVIGLSVGVGYVISLKVVDKDEKRQ